MRFLLNRLAPAVALAVWAAFAVAADDPPKLELRDGDRVVLVGDGFFEYDHERGYLETELTARYPDRDIRIRNLGRTGDTVWGDAWAGFDSAEQGFARRRDLVLSLDPTVLLISCGMNESFEGEAGLPRFVKGLNRMLDEFAPAKARIALVGPIPHEELPPPLPDPAAHNAELKRYSDAIVAVARERGLPVFDPAGEVMAVDPSGGGNFLEMVPLTFETTDGIHPSPSGYRDAAQVLGNSLMTNAPSFWHANLNAGPELPALDLSHLGVNPDTARTPRGIRFRVLDERLPDPQPPEAPLDRRWGGDRTMSVRGLEPGRYTLTIDGQPFAEASAEEWAQPLTIEDCPERRQTDELRKAIVAKNRLLYYRLRPENETYLYGFRKHEQGQNAAEVPRFDPLVAAKEEEIARLRVPKPHVYKIVRKESE